MNIADIRSMSDARLMEMHNSAAQNEGETIATCRAELARRDQESQTSSMLRLTKWITFMTGVMTAATIVNILLFALK